MEKPNYLLVLILSLAGRVLPDAFLTTIWYLKGVLSSSFESTGLLVSITTSKALVLVPGYLIFTASAFNYPTMS